jgi:ubiquinone/menaquinone biosynthesis C-methylase UbiE
MRLGLRRVPKSGLARAEVPGAFDVGAKAYDRLVGINPGYHDHLRISARRLRIRDSGRGMRLLDAGCGTGASTAALLEVAPHAEIIAVDASAGMLAQAAAKSWPDTVRFVHTPIEGLADADVQGPFDGILAAYLLRNLADPDAQLRRFRELLRPGATLAVHEYSVKDSAVAQQIWNAVCWGVIIPIGWGQSGDSTLYRHLWRSVKDFDGSTDVQRRLAAAGFTGVHSENMPGWQNNIVHTFLADAPAGYQGDR